MISDEEIEYYVKDNNLSFTKNPFHAIYILRNGKMIDGTIQYGIRGEDHRCMTGVIRDNYYSDFKTNFWSKFHYETGLVQMIPETKIALIMEKQILTKQQKEILDKTKYIVEAFCKAYKSDNT